MPNLQYPLGIQNLDNDAPYTILFDEYEKFQICHTYVAERVFYVVIIRILDSRFDYDTQMITINGIEFMVIHGFDKNPDFKDSGKQFTLDLADVVYNPPVELIHSEQDEEHHQVPLLNFRVKINRVDKLPKPRAVYKYLVPFKIDTLKGERLHFTCNIDGGPIPDTGNFSGKMCIGILNGKQIKGKYEDLMKMGAIIK